MQSPSTMQGFDLETGSKETDLRATDPICTQQPHSCGDASIQQLAQLRFGTPGRRACLTATACVTELASAHPA